VAYPWRAERSPWMSLAAEVLLQRTRAAQVAPVFNQFARRYPTPDALAKETSKGLLSVIGSLGLHWRAPLLIRTSEIVAERGVPPESYGELVELPGVGPYAAAAFLSLHRGVRVPILDANVVRWLGRVFGFKTDPETRRKPWVLELADQLTPKRAFRDFNYAVLDLSMTVCVTKPRCHACPLARQLCAFGRAAARKR
jgi:A/G-specific adenine glycosylase